VQSRVADAEVVGGPPQATDLTFANKLRATLSSKSHFGFERRSHAAEFIIGHYAGDVTYNCNKFLDKNRDSLSMGGCRCTRSSFLAWPWLPGQHPCCSTSR
jgi:myosin heavy subunit